MKQSRNSFVRKKGKLVLYVGTNMLSFFGGRGRYSNGKAIYFYRVSSVVPCTEWNKNLCLKDMLVNLVCYHVFIFTFDWQIMRTSCDFHNGSLFRTSFVSILPMVLVQFINGLTILPNRKTTEILMVFCLCFKFTETNHVGKFECFWKYAKRFNSLLKFIYSGKNAEACKLVKDIFML